jgi:hypothetical protein
MRPILRVANQSRPPRVFVRAVAAAPATPSTPSPAYCFFQSCQKCPLAAVGLPITGIPAEHFAVWELPRKHSEWHNLAGHDGQLLAGHRAYDRLACDLLPQQIGLAIVHHHVAFPQHARYPEFQRLPLDPAIEYQAAVAQRATADEHGSIADLIVHEFMPDQDF